jgi:hypothetical protein
MSDYFFSFEWCVDVPVYLGLGYVSGEMLWLIANEENQ